MVFDKWAFVHVSDIQVGSACSFRFAPAYNENWQTARKQILEIDREFLLIGGDLTRDGNLHRFELENVKGDLDRLPFDCHIVPGNTDVGNKYTDIASNYKGRNDPVFNITSEWVEQYNSLFGPDNWSFVHKNVRFTGINNMLCGSGLPQEKEMWCFLESLKRAPLMRGGHIWIMHHPIFCDELDEPNWEITDPEQYFAWYFGIDEPDRSRLMDIFTATGASRVISGHIHCRRHCCVEGIHFDFAPATCMGQWHDRWPDGDPTLGFLKYEVGAESIEPTFIPLERVSTRKGYGLVGHVPPDKRDYRLAWEKQT